MDDKVGVRNVSYRNSSPKIIYDSVKVNNCGLMKLTPWMLDVVDTPQFQRLRDVRQLGSVPFVFPGAVHTRFEHCLGVGVLANTLISRFQRDQKDLEITENDVKRVTIAGLCHDLGHGPFSHVFDDLVVPELGLSEKWSHEEASQMMVDDLATDGELKFLDDIDNDVKFINQLIVGKNRTAERAFLFDIVANERNSVDVDKFDYLQRDSYYLGMKQVHDIDRLMLFSRVEEDQIKYPYKERQNLYDMFHARYSLFKRVYTHPAVKAIDFMIADALIKAKDVIPLAEAVKDPKLYVMLDDTILRRIESSTEEKLKPSREILRRLRKRKLYKFVGEYLIPADCRAAHDKNSKKYVEKITRCGKGLSENDVIVKIEVLNFGMRDKNPLDYIKFYDDGVPRYEDTRMVPECYQEKYLRVFVRDTDKAPLVKEAFEKYCTEDADFFRSSGNSTLSRMNGYSPNSAS